MIVIALITSSIGLEEKLSVLLSFVGLLAGFIWINRQTKNLNFSHWYPKLIRKQVSEDAHIPMCEID